MAANKIKEKALSLFIEMGYEGASLADIGEEVGIKKQSIYSHFKNKDDLFLQVINEVVEEETHYTNKYFNEAAHKSIHDILYNYIVHLKERYKSDGEENIKFLIRMMFTPPNHLKKTVISTVLIYYMRLQKLIRDAFLKHEDSLIINAEEGTISFMNFIDGLLVELIYINVESFEKRFEISWDIYWRGISQTYQS